MGNIQVLSGDLSIGTWRLSGRPGACALGRWLGGERIDLHSKVRTLVAMDQETRKGFLRTSTAAWLANLVLGHPGLIAGALAGGNGRIVTFRCELQDGRRFVAHTDGPTWRALLATCPHALKQVPL